MADFTIDHQSFSGARGLLKLRGQQIADVENVACSWTNNYIAHKPCGAMKVKEHVCVGRFVESLTVGRIKRMGADLTEYDLEAHEIPALLEIAECTMVIIDEPTGKPVFTIEGCKLRTGGFTMDANGLVVENASFVAIDVRTELEAAS